jgi:SAM-dependent methyltransferase
MSHILYRKEKILQLCRDKTVLHLGFVQHSHLYRQMIEEDNWLHGKIATVATHLVGMDYLSEEVDTIRQEFGYECYSADVTKLESLKHDQQYDVIVCGELIEHVENAGLMLDGIKRFLAPEGILLITTPNPWSKERISLIRHNQLEEKWLNKEHVSWYSHQTLRQLLERKNFQEVDYNWYLADSYQAFLGNCRGPLGLLRYIKKQLELKIRPKIQYDGLFFVAKLPPKEEIR